MSDFGAPPPELVWFVSPGTEAYDCLLYRAMTAELWLAAAFGGVYGPRPAYHLQPHNASVEARRDVWERACLAIGIGTD